MSSIERPTTRRWREALEHVDALLQTSSDERERLLRELSGSEPQLHSLVISLLDAEQQAAEKGFLEPSTGPETGALQPDALLGPYRLLRRLGEGGMGEVWLARRDDGLYDGEVAIKTLHPYFAGGALRERFLREAQLLGKLKHPNIGRLLDAGVTATGAVYLVLEYVDGVDLAAWCDERRLDIPSRLKLFLDVCAAVAHAHSNLIVHRDIKPTNILVTASGEVKLLDFGVAKLVDPDPLNEAKELTRMTGRIFTPEYAAPEQILGEQITTATDIYSLGVLLHVLCTGARPYAIQDGTDIERAVLHREPIRASRCVADDAQRASVRSTTPSRLRNSLAGDLDNIISLAMRKAPAERYGSVLAFAADVRSHLEHRPIAARKESLAVRSRKFVRRHRVGVAASALAVAAIGAGLGGILWQAHIAREQARLAAQEAQKATAVKDFLLDIFNQNSEAHPDGASARQTTAEALLDIASNEILSQLDQEPEVRLELMATMGQLNLTLEKYPQVEALQRERVRYATERFGPNDLRVAAAQMDLAVFLRQRGQTAEARSTIESAIQTMDALGDRTSLMRGHAQARLAQIVYMQSAAPDPTPIEYYQRALEILERLPPSDQLVDATLGLARSYELARRWEDAIVTNRRGIELAMKVNGAQAVAVGGGHQQLARCLARVNRLDEAESSLARAVEVFTFVVGPENGFTLGARRDAAALKLLRGKHRDVIAELEAVLPIMLDKDGTTNHWVNQIRHSLARALLAVGRGERARPHLDEGIEMSANDPKRQIRVLLLQTRAELAYEESRVGDALSDLQLAEDIADGLPGPQDHLVAGLLATKGEVLLSAGRVEEAVAALGDAKKLLAVNEADARKPEQLRVAIALATADAARGRHSQARDEFRKVLAAIKSQSRPDELWLLQERAHHGMSAASLALGDREAACRSLATALQIRRGNSLPGDARLRGTEAAFEKKQCDGST